MPTDGDFPDGPVAKILRSQCRGPGFHPRLGTSFHMLQLRPGIAKQIIFLNTYRGAGGLHSR